MIDVQRAHAFRIYTYVQRPPDEFIAHAATIRGRLLFLCARGACGYYSRAATIRCAAIVRINTVVEELLDSREHWSKGWSAGKHAWRAAWQNLKSTPRVQVWELQSYQTWRVLYIARWKWRILGYTGCHGRLFLQTVRCQAYACNISRALFTFQF